MDHLHIYHNAPSLEAIQHVLIFKFAQSATELKNPYTVKVVIFACVIFALQQFVTFTLVFKFAFFNHPS